VAEPQEQVAQEHQPEEKPKEQEPVVELPIVEVAQEQPEEKPVPETPFREAMQDIQAEVLEGVPQTPMPVADGKKEETLEDMLGEVIQQPLPDLSPSPEREPQKKKQLGLGGTVADPASETRREFLERARKKLKCPMAKIIEKAKAVEGLWELWPEERRGGDAAREAQGQGEGQGEGEGQG
jgi:hypothetical protein